MPALARAHERLRRDVRRLDPDPLGSRRADLRRGVRARRRWSQSGAPASHDDIPFENPPAAAVVALPFTLLGAGAAWRAWSLLQLALCCSRSSWSPARRRGRHRCRDCRGWPSCSSRWPDSAPVCSSSRVSGTVSRSSGLAAAYALWRRDRPAAAGFALGFTAAIAKPQLVIGIAAYMIGRRDWRAVGGALAGAAVSVVIGLIGAGPRSLGSFVTRDRHAEQLADRPDAGHERPLRVAPGSCAGRVPARGRGRNRGRWGGGMAGDRRPSASRSLRALALRRCGPLALRVAASARARPDAARARPRRRPGLAGRPTRGASSGRARRRLACSASGCCSRLPASAIYRRTPSASPGEPRRGCCCSWRRLGAFWSCAPLRLTGGATMGLARPVATLSARGAMIERLEWVRSCR